MKKKCLDCGKPISKRATRCSSCAAKARRQSGVYDNAFGEEFSKKMSGVIRSNWASGSYDTESWRKGCSERMKAVSANRTYVSKPLNRCLDCGKEIKRQSKRCRSCASKYQWADDQYREATFQGMRSPEARRKRSEAAKKMWASGVMTKAFNTPEYRRKRSELAKAQFSTPEARRKNSEMVKAAWARGCYVDAVTPELRKKRSENLKAAWARGCYDNKLPCSSETRRKRSENAKKQWARGAMDGVFKNPSSIEIEVSKALEELGLPNSPQYRLHGDGHPFDFFVPPNVLIEVDGEYWHSRPDAKKRDQLKSKLAAERGFRLVRISESELKKRGARILVKERILPNCCKP